MGIIGGLEKRAAETPTFSDITGDKWWFPGGDFFGGLIKSKSGSIVNEYTALKFATFWCCVRILSQTEASLPLFLHKRRPDGGKERASDKDLYSKIHQQPNPEMTSMTFRETGMAHLVTWGNWYAEKKYAGKINRLESLWPIPPNRVTVRRNKQKKLVYDVKVPPNNEVITIPGDRMLHIPGLGFDGIKGYSPVKMTMEALGLGMTLEEFSNRFFSQGTNIGGVVTLPQKKISEKAEENFVKSFAEKYGNLGKSHRLLFLEDGSTYEKIGIPPNESQFIESKKFSNIDIGTRILQVPPYMYGEMEKSAWANVEQQQIDFIIYTMRSWLVRLEQAFNMHFLEPYERDDYFFEHLIDGLLRGDTATRYEAYTKALQSGWMSPDDIREKENMNPLPDGQGQVYLIQLNMMSLKDVGKDTQPIPGKEENSIDRRSLLESRKKQGILIRNRLARAYHPLYLKTAEAIMLKETKALRSALKKNFQRSQVDFNEWLDEFYKTFPDYIRKKILPVLKSYAEAIREAALGEIGSEAKVKAELEKFLNTYADTYSGRHINSSLAQIRQIVRDSEPEETQAALEERVGQWEERRAGKIADDEVVRVGGAVARTVWTLAGVMSFVWIAQGSKSCEYCQQLDGQVVGKEKTFVSAGDVLSGSGGDMKVTGDHLHPPLHEGCVCSVSPNVG